MLGMASMIMRILNWLNWVVVALFGLLLVLTVAVPGEFMRHAAVMPKADPRDVLLAIRLLCCVVLAAGPATHFLLTRLGAILDTVAAGDPFILRNGERLRTVGWALLAIQLIDLVFGFVAVRISAQTGEYLGWSFSLGGWIAVLLVFVLAEVWTQGAAMRDDLQGTV